jgi:peroxiredoxin Q/BCP
MTARFADANAQVLGVSTDDAETQSRFAKSLTLPFPLLADVGGKVAAEYGVLKTIGVAERATFVIGPDGKILKVVRGKDALDPTEAAAACPIHKPGAAEKKG